MIPRIAGDKGAPAGVDFELRNEWSKVIRGYDERRCRPSIEKTPRRITTTLKQGGRGGQTKTMLMLDARPWIAERGARDCKRNGQQRDNRYRHNLDESSSSHLDQSSVDETTPCCDLRPAVLASGRLLI